MRLLTLVTWTLLSVLEFSAQTPRTNSQLDGYWTGAFIKERSIQTFELEFFMENDTLRSSLTIPDWAYYAPVVRPVRTNNGRYEIASHYGWMRLDLDTTYAELIGECDFAKVHMKKSLRPVIAEIDVLPMEFDLGDIVLQGELTRLKGQKVLPAAILVHGRGCAGFDNWQKRPEVLAQYGLAVVTFDKRGNYRTGIDCETTDIQMHARDLAAISKQLKGRADIGALGYIGYSTGGWVAPMAAARSEVTIDFIVSVVGPSTSIRQQQLDCSEYFLRDRLGVGDMEIAQAQQLVELQCSTDPASELYPKIKALVEDSKENGWFDLLEASDVPDSVEDISTLWLQRNQYEPAADLQSFKGPFLSILGGDDMIVPWKPNSDRFHQLFKEVGKENFEVVILAAASHGLEHGALERSLNTLDGEDSLDYFKFDRVAAGALDEIIRFLREMEVISK